MPKKEILERYSCKRKKDFMTVFAVCFFLLIVAAELYLVFYVPVQLQKEGILQKHIAKENTIKLMDTMRQSLYVFRKNASSKTESQEMYLASQILDDYAQYSRLNMELLSHRDILELLEQIQPYEALVYQWRDKKFIFKERNITLRGLYQSLEKKHNL